MVYVGQEFEVKVFVSYTDQTYKHILLVGVVDPFTNSYVGGHVQDYIQGTGTKIYSFKLTAPLKPLTWSLSARVHYKPADHPEQSYAGNENEWWGFTVNIQEQVKIQQASTSKPASTSYYTSTEFVTTSTASSPKTRDAQVVASVNPLTNLYFILLFILLVTLSAVVLMRRRKMRLLQTSQIRCPKCSSVNTIGMNAAETAASR